MLTLTRIIKNHRYISSVIAFALFGILTGATVGVSRRAMRKGSQQPQRTPLNMVVNNKTQALQFVESEKVTMGSISSANVKLYNASNKPIKVVTLSAGRAGIVDDRMLSDETIAAGSTVTEAMPLVDESQFGSTGPVLTIHAVLFSDGTAEGEDQTVQVLKDEWAGVREQAKRVIKQLQDASNTADRGAALSKLQADATALGTTSKGSPSKHYDDGMKKAKDRLVRALNEITQQRQSNLAKTADAQLERLIKVYQSLAEAN